MKGVLLFQGLYLQTQPTMVPPHSTTIMNAKHHSIVLRDTTILRTQAPLEACVEVSKTLFLPQSLPNNKCENSE